MTELIIVVCVIFVVGGIIRARWEAKLLDKNPEAWAKLKEAQEKKKEQRRRAVGSAAFSIAKILLKK